MDRVRAKIIEMVAQLPDNQLNDLLEYLEAAVPSVASISAIYEMLKDVFFKFITSNSHHNKKIQLVFFYHFSTLGIANLEAMTKLTALNSTISEHLGGIMPGDDDLLKRLA